MNPEELKRRVARIRQELEEAADGKYPAPRLIAVTKTHSAEEILPLADAGVSVSNGSDCPVELPDVMAGIECAVTRMSRDGTGPYLPEQAFTVREALDSFTLRGAEASF